MLQGHFSNRTNAPQPQLLIVAVIWVIALICVSNGTNQKWAWCMVAMASVLTVYVGVRFWLYYGARKSR
jgi:hypothetical protein